MYEIKKQFDFCYGHRVWTQKLNPEFSLDACLKCRHLHGHQGKIEVTLHSETLDNDMVTDFKHLSWLKKWLDDTLDHKFILDINDPICKNLFPEYFIGNLIDRAGLIRHNETPSPYYTLNLDYIQGKEEYLKEIYEGIVLVQFVPTSENFSSWLFNFVHRKMKEINVTVKSVEFFETPKTSSKYFI